MLLKAPITKLAPLTFPPPLLPLPSSNGSGYTDELVQIAVNQDLYGADSVCEKQHWVLQDANYNVMGLVDSDGDLVERYEYSPYGERKVFVSAGTNDPGCYAPTLLSRRVKDSYASLDQPFGLCEFGHQGLPHEEEIDNGSMIQNRRRVLIARLGRHLQTDPAGYVDGPSRYQYVISNPVRYLDPSGLSWSLNCCDKCKSGQRRVSNVAVGLANPAARGSLGWDIGPDTLETINELPDAIEKSFDPVGGIIDTGSEAVEQALGLAPGAAGSMMSSWANTEIPSHGNVEMFGSGPENMTAKQTPGGGRPSTNYTPVVEGMVTDYLVGEMQQATIEAGKRAMQAAMEIDRQRKEAFGVQIFVVVKYKKCNRVTCYPWFWKKHLDWADRQYRHRCESSYPANGAPGHYVDGTWQVNDQSGISRDIPGCVRRAIAGAMSQP